MSWQLKALRVVMRYAVRRSLGRQRDSIAARAWFERGAWLNARGRPYKRFTSDRLHCDGHDVPALWTALPAPEQPFLLYFHGGGYVMGNPRTHAALATYLTRKTGLQTCLPDYRLAPEHPFPAAFDDALCVWRALLARGIAPQSIALGGDSAGGGLALAMLGHLCATGQPRPSCVFTFSPFTDLSLSGGTITSNARSELLLPPQRLEQLRNRVLAGADPRDPRISPLFGSFKDAPPVLIQVARSEILLDDSRRMAEVLKRDGAAVTVQEWGNLPHVWQFFHGWLPEARKALTDAATFIRQQYPPAPTGGS
ncbi:acetyl esterase/lipase [Roseinatronobacter thiooxidans]|uniref:Acetyl esterase/lipase n=1 Tax=Roseinatronobacter thiooxidans TaxID=121821 RepID=A0A2W7QZY3_9RHOB|nr:alpha/beta hydrolase [Roseinatronobacter thiooxidans]PZX47409.1 acetyl esterase/lipase [Roseinatronobacter thiooxidans]